MLALLLFVCPGFFFFVESSSICFLSVGFLCLPIFFICFLPAPFFWFFCFFFIIPLLFSSSDTVFL